MGSNPVSHTDDQKCTQSSDVGLMPRSTTQPPSVAGGPTAHRWAFVRIPRVGCAVPVGPCCTPTHPDPCCRPASCTASSLWEACIGRLCSLPSLAYAAGSNCSPSKVLRRTPGLLRCGRSAQGCILLLTTRHQGGGGPTHPPPPPGPPPNFKILASGPSAIKKFSLAPPKTQHHWGGGGLDPSTHPLPLTGARGGGGGVALIFIPL